MIHELKLLQDIGLTLAIWVGIAAIVVLTVKLLSNPNVEGLKRAYEERIEGLKRQINDLRELLKTKDIAYREELKKYTKINKMLQELNKALEHGAIKLACPQHQGSEVTILADGTIVCSKGHRLWPLEVKEVEVGEET